MPKHRTELRINGLFTGKVRVLPHNGTRADRMEMPLLWCWRSAVAGDMPTLLTNIFRKDNNMTTDREALVKRIQDAIRCAQDETSPALILSAKSCRELLAALSAQGGEQSDTVSVPREPSERFVEIVAKELCKHAYPARSLDEALSPNVRLWMRLKDEARQAITAVLAAAEEGKK